VERVFLKLFEKKQRDCLPAERPHKKRTDKMLGLFPNKTIKLWLTNYAGSRKISLRRGITRFCRLRKNFLGGITEFCRLRKNVLEGIAGFCRSIKNVLEGITEFCRLSQNPSREPKQQNFVANALGHYLALPSGMEGE
jgi:hypothetical protein